MASAPTPKRNAPGSNPGRDILLRNAKVIFSHGKDDLRIFHFEPITKISQRMKPHKRGILPLQKSTFPYICIANKGKCFCLAHYEVTIAKDTVNSQ